MIGTTSWNIGKPPVSVDTIQISKNEERDGRTNGIRDNKIGIYFWILKFLQSTKARTTGIFTSIAKPTNPKANKFWGHYPLAKKISLGPIVARRPSLESDFQGHHRRGLPDSSNKIVSSNFIPHEFIPKPTKKSKAKKRISLACFESFEAFWNWWCKQPWFQEGGRKCLDNGKSLENFFSEQR